MKKSVALMFAAVFAVQCLTAQVAEGIKLLHYEKNKSAKVPAIFPKKYYDELLKLDADFGAKEILQKESCINIQLEKDFCIDIDTLEDMKFLEIL